MRYVVSSSLAKEDLETNRSLVDLILEKDLLSQEEINKLLSPENMINPTKMRKV